MSEVKRISVFMHGPNKKVDMVEAAHLDRVTAERDAALAELAQANEKIDKAWNRKPETDHKGFIPGAVDAWKRPVPQHLPYDFSGNPGASATQYCNGWNDCGGYWSAHAKELQQRLTAADERADVLEGLLRLLAELPGVRTSGMWERVVAALKPAEPATDEHVCNGCGSRGWTANCKECVPY